MKQSVLYNIYTSDIPKETTYSGNHSENSNFNKDQPSDNVSTRRNSVIGKIGQKIENRY